MGLHTVRGLYVKTGWDPPKANKEVEEILDNFQGELQRLKKANRKYLDSNLTHTQQRTCDKIRSNKNYKAWASDKNLGPVFCGTTQYTRRGVTNHLGNDLTYKRMMAREANVRMIRIRYRYVRPTRLPHEE